MRVCADALAVDDRTRHDGVPVGVVPGEVKWADESVLMVESEWKRVGVVPADVKRVDESVLMFDESEWKRAGQ
jgi:hypothetical protein